MRAREFMKLRENIQGPMSVVGFEQWFAANPEEWLEDDIESMGGVENFVAKVNGWITTLPNPLTLYRGLHVSDIQSWLKNPERPLHGGLGIYWTDDYGTAINENGDEGSFGRLATGELTNIVMVAQVPHNVVDWCATAAIRVLDTEEPEITLLSGAAVHVSEVHVLDFDPESRETIGQNHVTQTIPVGRTFRA